MLNEKWATHIKTCVGVSKWRKRQNNSKVTNIFIDKRTTKRKQFYAQFLFFHPWSHHTVRTFGIKPVYCNRRKKTSCYNNEFDVIGLKSCWTPNRKSNWRTCFQAICYSLEIHRTTFQVGPCNKCNQMLEQRIIEPIEREHVWGQTIRWKLCQAIVCTLHRCLCMNW